jgi:hypothetical protein
MNVRLQLIYSHSLDCTRVPWESLTSLVISLTLVNGFTSMTGNQVVSTMFDIKTSIHMARFVPHQDWDEDPGLSIHSVIFFSQAAKEII